MKKRTPVVKKMSSRELPVTDVADAKYSVSFTAPNGERRQRVFYSAEEDAALTFYSACHSFGRSPKLWVHQEVELVARIKK